ncbi:DUF2267 domain-containing protein [Pseudonocardia sp. NPDC049154]|uniref:DUF2267 domain-containing protein n=1 Tax=Pseudonocardia sp. NPDC049154 TaxID=3155501 RepID=UPI0033DF68B6
MDYATFTKTTAERAGLPEETAERIEHATLRTLADRITGGEAQDLAAQLPGGLIAAVAASLEEPDRDRGPRSCPAPSRAPPRSGGRLCTTTASPPWSPR